MFKFMLIITCIISGLSLLIPDNASSNTSVSSSYNQCINDPNTQFQIGVYKQKYPNLSNSSIAHIICK